MKGEQFSLNACFIKTSDFLYLYLSLSFSLSIYIYTFIYIYDEYKRGYQKLEKSFESEFQFAYPQVITKESLF